MFCECLYFIIILLLVVDYLILLSNWLDLGLLNISLVNILIVDIFIFCCKEFIEVFIEFVKVVLVFDYFVDLVKVFVFDDGGDDDFWVFCDVIKVEIVGRVVYICWEKKEGVFYNFKCGNMNNGLKYLNVEYVVMMDVDMIFYFFYLCWFLLYIVSFLDVFFV